MRRLICPLLALLACGCHDGRVTEAGGPMADDAGTTLRVPPRASFDRVADALVEGCGTLDCHGQPGRNLRLYGSHGLRLLASDDPGSSATTPQERDADYWAVVGLEPETMDAVVRAGGDAPERLSLVRKALGMERHKGGTLAKLGDPFDRCLRAWLASGRDDAACMAALPRRP